MNISANIKQQIENVLPELVAIRHELHRNPQNGFEETFASELVQRFLSEHGIDFQAGLAKTGVVGWILPDDPAAAKLSAVALRADMDALPLDEDTGLDYASQNQGWMHACGHDGHTAMLLGAAAILAKNKAALTRPVKLIFQPAEENLGGAEPMIEQGCLDERTGGLAVEKIFGIHNWPAAAAGEAATKSGPFFASVDGFKLTITGQGGHGACPETTRDPVLASAHVITALQSIKSRNLAATTPAVVSVCCINGGHQSNIIPNSVEIMGTIRAYDDAIADDIKKRVEKIAADTASAFECESEFELLYGYPVLVNDDDYTSAVADVAREVFGDDMVEDNQPLVTVSEDFAYYSKQAKGCYFLLGSGGSQLHNPKYDFNDEIIPNGVELFCKVAMMV